MSGKIPRFALMASAMIALLAGLWAGLLRMGWALPTLHPALIGLHGPLMVCGFVGVLIGVERAVALSALSNETHLRRYWYFLSASLTALGSLALLVRLPVTIGVLLITSGSAMLVVIFIVMVRRYAAIYTYVMLIGAIAWLIGNLLWLSGQPISMLIWWWIAFLLLTIIAERLELSRVVKSSTDRHLTFIVSVGVFLAGTVFTLVSADAGTRIAGIGSIAIGLWLLRYDIARHTVRRTGLPRFVAVCLLMGYGWLLFSGVLAIALGQVTAGFYYDAMLHGIFVGFVFSMIFGHALIILPSVLGAPIKYHPFLYVPLGLLHLSLVLRMVGNLAGMMEVRQWGGLLNETAIVLFLVSVLAVQRLGSKQKQAVD